MFQLPEMGRLLLVDVIFWKDLLQESPEEGAGRAQAPDWCTEFQASSDADDVIGPLNQSTAVTIQRRVLSKKPQFRPKIQTKNSGTN